MTRTNLPIFSLLAMILFSCLEMYAGGIHKKAALKNSGISAPESKSAMITRKIDVTEHFRPFPELTAYRNTSLQKATTPVLAEVSENAYGKAKITRCWLNLDEMWDYRTREFNFNHQIGVDKYKQIAEKFRESWNWEVESPVHFYDYITAFSKHSEEIMLTIRRYERDIIDGKLPITMEEWIKVFKTGLKHYKMLCPNIRYIEVGNEYYGKSFMNATEEEYYPFYKAGYKAVNEVNEELGLQGSDRILVGGPVTNGQLQRMDRFLELYKLDITRTKRLDFFAYHEYGRPVVKTPHWEKDIEELLKKQGVPENIPLFFTEHDPFHGSRDVNQLEYHMLNTAYLPKSLYFNSLFSPRVKIFPWVLYHDQEIQTKFMWFDGPNEPDTKAFEMRMLPLGASMKMLSMHQGREIRVDNSIEANDLVIASVQKDKIIVQAINYDSPKDVKVSLKNISTIFPELKNGKMKVIKYLIDSRHSNCLTIPEYPGGLEKIDELLMGINNEGIILENNDLEKNGLVLWEIVML